ncbi:MAG TPA: hypothetical protein VIG64_14845, partial [Actinomycetota bacterium]
VVARKLHLLGLVLALCVSAVPALAGGAKSRTASGEYNTVTVSDADPSGPIVAGRIANGVTFETKPGERFVEVYIEDESGLPVRAVVGQDLDGDATEDVKEEICGATTAPIKLRKNAVVMVWTQEGACADGTNAVATFGTITATFTRTAHMSGHHHHH